MTVQVGIVNLLLETHGGSRQRGDATWYLLIFDYLSTFGFQFSMSHLQTQIGCLSHPPLPQLRCNFLCLEKGTLIASNYQVTTASSYHIS